MTNGRNKLWTIALGDLVKQARATGQARASWDRVEPRWRPAYLWMLDCMRQRGITNPADAEPSPPIWAWHSCGEWQRPPVADTVDMLFGIDPENRRDLCLVSWSAPVESLLLSRYAAWCQVLDVVIAGGTPAGMENSVLCPRLTSPNPPWWWVPGEDLQACVHTLAWRDIESVSPLPTVPSTTTEEMR